MCRSRHKAINAGLDALGNLIGLTETERQVVGHR
jgi:hypothetical protein